MAGPGMNSGPPFAFSNGLRRRIFGDSQECQIEIEDPGLHSQLDRVLFSFQRPEEMQHAPVVHHHLGRKPLQTPAPAHCGKMGNQFCPDALVLVVIPHGKGHLCHLLLRVEVIARHPQHLRVTFLSDQGEDCHLVEVVHIHKSLDEIVGRSDESEEFEINTLLRQGEEKALVARPVSDLDGPQEDIDAAFRDPPGFQLSGVGPYLYCRIHLFLALEALFPFPQTFRIQSLCSIRWDFNVSSE